MQKYRGKNKFQGALFLKHYQKHAGFPAFSAIRSVIEQLECDDSVHDFDFQDRTAERQRRDIRDYLGFRTPNAEDYSNIHDWLCVEIIEEPEQANGLYEGITQWCLIHKTEKPSAQKQERIIRGALAAFEADIFRRVKVRLSNDSRLAVANASFHNHKRIQEIVAPDYHMVIPLPPYSPDLNPIEKTFGAMKNRRKSMPPNTTID